MLMSLFGTRGEKYAKIALLVLALIIIAVVVFFVVKRTEQHNYAALGDSISAGYGLNTADESYPAVLFGLLEDEGHVDAYLNLATDNFTTAMLLEQLRGLGKEEKQYFTGTQIITINIGWNNILTPFLEYLSENQIVSGADSVMHGAGDLLLGSWGVLYGIFSNVGGLINDSEDFEINVGDVISSAGEIITGAGGIIAGAGEMISGSPKAFSAFSGSLPPELETELENGVQAFSNEFSEIMEWIKANAPKAVVIVNTVYNPIPQEILSVSLEISNVSGALVDSINNIIVEECRERGHIVIDTSDLMSDKSNMSQFNLNPQAGALSLDIVHPNKSGHSQIAQQSYDAFIKAKSS